MTLILLSKIYETRCFIMKSIFNKTENVLALGGLGLLQRPLIVNIVVVIAIITDFTVFYSSFSKCYEFLNALITSITCATLIDTIPLVISHCILELRSSVTKKHPKQWYIIVLVASISAFLSFFAFTAVVRWENGPSMFELDSISSSKMSSQAELTTASLTASQQAMLALLCFLPLFTSVMVLLIGLFTEQNAQRWKKLRIQKNKLLNFRIQRTMQLHELEAMSKMNLEDIDKLCFDDISKYTNNLCNLLRVYFRMALAEKLKKADDSTYLSAKSQELVEMENRILQLADTTIQPTISVNHE